jgi:hypothetical protein
VTIALRQNASAIRGGSTSKILSVVAGLVPTIHFLRHARADPRIHPLRKTFQ